MAPPPAAAANNGANGAAMSEHAKNSSLHNTDFRHSVKLKKEPDRILLPGRPDLERCDNKVVSARYTLYSFIPVAVTEQFRRFANMYFLIIGVIMFIGYYTPLYESAISPWTTLGPLAVVISFSLLVEGSADYKRHVNDQVTNNAPCVILRRVDEMQQEEGAERDNTIIHGKDVVVNINKAYYANISLTPGPDGRRRTNTEGSVDPNDDGTSGGPVNVRIGFQKIRRMNIRQGHFVLVRNREMVPADIVLLASSNDNGSAYIETSSIDGETNLKLRTSPHLPKKILDHLRDGTKLSKVHEEPPRFAGDYNDDEESEGIETAVDDDDASHGIETIEQATKRLTRFSCLGRPFGESALNHPQYKNARDELEQQEQADEPARTVSELSKRVRDKFRNSMNAIVNHPAGEGSSNTFGAHHHHHGQPNVNDGKYVAALTTEPPNPSVHTFSGKLTLPPFESGGECYDIPLGAENVLLRGAVVRNTEWIIGLAFFTGTDTKLIQNSFETPSKFSQLDRLMNFTVLNILCIMVLCITYLATMAVTQGNDQFDNLWYAGFNSNATAKWPYMPDGFDPPEWSTSNQNWLQFFLLYVTLLNNFIPLSLYVTVEFITFCMLWFVYADLDMYDDTTNTRAVARSTIVTDLGRIQYIFSDKTGTLTQNVMRFKRCSVDGMIFGAPIQKSRPGETQANDGEDDDGGGVSAFHPLRHLLVGKFKRSRKRDADGLEGLGETSPEELEPDDKLTFNAEMFLRVMCLCHTVVVEKDIDEKKNIDSGTSVGSTPAGKTKTSFFGRKRTASQGSPMSSVSEEATSVVDSNSGRNTPSQGNSGGGNVDLNTLMLKGVDGAPLGYAYQAESPDEGALVSAASSIFGFQVITRDSNGIKIATNAPSHFQDERITEKLAKGKISLQRLAAESASELDGGDEAGGLVTTSAAPDPYSLGEPRIETWQILAVNKFDSDRKRMSILLRSPPDLGSLPVLFCKGADTAMLDPAVCTSSRILGGDEGSLASSARDSAVLSTVTEDKHGTLDTFLSQDQEDWEMAQMLGLQAHLGDFASEGLRTLVLGMRILSEQECTEWMEEYKSAATSMKNRSEMLTAAAMKVERGLHIVGATAIEDKLQRGVPDTIATLEKAGIKLWVLTGDKRETAVEIGYSTHVLTPKMHLTECADNGKMHVRTQMSMEFMRLVKMGKLREYQKIVVNQEGKPTFSDRITDFQFAFGKCWRSMNRMILTFMAAIFSMIGAHNSAQIRLDKVAESEQAERDILKDIERKRRTRECAEKTIQTWLESEEGLADRAKRQQSGRVREDDELSLTSEERPQVFNRATSARSLLKEIRQSGKVTNADLRKASLAHLTAQQMNEEEPLVDEDTLSLASFFPGNKDDISGRFDKAKRTLLERLFAIDRQVRKGQLKKHMKTELLESLAEQRAGVSTRSDAGSAGPSKTGPRALVIEGAALKHLLGDPKYEEILFAVASNCEAVIACRVSPKQKALLVGLVRQNIKPEPITLAIGDGANDVGMIQEAHVGVGISGKEGQQAVNASDFSIAQFRFLEELVLIHGRWNFFRLSTVVLFSFYKNALMAGVLILFSASTLYTGTPLFDEWLIAMLNFVAGMPIVMSGLFDRCLSKEYVRAHPEVYQATRDNELITMRTLMRWILLVFVHLFTLYYFTVPQQAYGGGITPAWYGLMRNNNADAPGEGEGGDLKSVGTVTFTCMILILAYKVLFETRSLVHGRWPAFTCRKDVKEGFFSRLAYTWVGLIWLSIAFYMFAICIYQLIGRASASQFSMFTNVTNHVLGTRSMSWMLIAFVPISAMIFDVSGKVFSNLFYPTQTQIHVERESKAKSRARRARRAQGSAQQRITQSV